MTLCKYVAGDDNSVYFTELVKLLTSGQKLYKAKRWWSISIVGLLFVLQISYESTEGESKPQDGTSLDQVNAAHKNKFLAEELIRKRKLQAVDDERVKKDSRKDAFMDSGFFHERALLLDCKCRFSAEVAETASPSAHIEDCSSYMASPRFSFCLAVVDRLRRGEIVLLHTR